MAAEAPSGAAVFFSEASAGVSEPRGCVGSITKQCLTAGLLRSQTVDVVWRV
jgi:hypothetical protein